MLRKRSTVGFECFCLLSHSHPAGFFPFLLTGLTSLDRCTPLNITLRRNLNAPGTGCACPSKMPRNKWTGQTSILRISECLVLLFRRCCDQITTLRYHLLQRQACLHCECRFTYCS
ncbi:hypothetical protein BDN70DRAFT_413898 [Pholiota conissans]|uniref:Uncharacterized protein n=1 Tax=Pholiota conissans TaxID=109636 RepID=A0A9P5YNJ9_9AGAR|nr:hypothetical protein BDN70DRAFT_413898 [Pholiota conissans]